MHPAPFLPAPPLGSALVEIVGSEPTACLVAGPKAVARALVKAGHAVTRWQVLGETDAPTPRSDTRTDGVPLPRLEEESCSAPPQPLYEGPLGSPPQGMDRYGALVLSGVLTGLREPGLVLANLASHLPPRAWVIVVEPAAWSTPGLLLGRVLGKLRGRSMLTEPSTLAAMCLASGLTDLRQRWPQGLRSLVLTAGRVSPLRSSLSP